MGQVVVSGTTGGGRGRGGEHVCTDGTDDCPAGCSAGCSTDARCLAAIVADEMGRCDGERWGRSMREPGSASKTRRSSSFSDTVCAAGGSMPDGQMRLARMYTARDEKPRVGNGGVTA